MHPPANRSKGLEVASLCKNIMGRFILLKLGDFETPSGKAFERVLGYFFLFVLEYN